MDRYVDIRGWTSGPLHACADAVLIQVGTIGCNALMFPVQHCFSFLYLALGSILISYFLARHCAFLAPAAQ